MYQREDLFPLSHVSRIYSVFFCKILELVLPCFLLLSSFIVQHTELICVQTFFRSLSFISAENTITSIFLLAVLKATLIMLSTCFSPSVYALVSVLYCVRIDGDMDLQFHGQVATSLNRHENQLGQIRLYRYLFYSCNGVKQLILVTLVEMSDNFPIWHIWEIREQN